MATIKQIKIDDVIHDINAVRLDIDTKGSTTQPVYFSEGKPVACTYELKKTVPSDAKFTDTTYTLNSFGITATAAELNKMDGVTATTAELNYVDGVTSNIQTQLNAKAAATTLSSHTENKSNPHGVTKSQVGLGNVENKSSATIRGELTSSNVTTALGFTPSKEHSHNYIPTSEKGVASGVATLDTNGKVPSTQLPSYVDDVLEYDKLTSFPTTGETGKIYIAKDTNKTYRWSGSAYTVISETLALGETSSTAYAGDKGKANATAIAALQTKVGDTPVADQISDAISEIDMEVSWDDIQDRPFYEEPPVETVLVDNATIELVDMNGDGSIGIAENPFTMEIAEGAEYTVTWNGDVYTATGCVDADGVPYVGNYAIATGMNDTGEPFLLIDLSAFGRGFGVYSTIVGAVTINVSAIIANIHTIDLKYLPSSVKIGSSGEGIGSEIFNDYEYNTATGENSHAEGYSTTASGGNSHAEGYSTTASGDISHAEGANTTASGQISHAEGYLTTASGDMSHAEGANTIAAGWHQHVQGKYNVEDADNKYAHIVGNGKSNTKRSNAHTLDWDGNAWFAGDVTVGADAKKLATEDHNHDDRYYTETEINTKFSNLVGDTAVATQISNAIDAITPSSIGASESGHTHSSYANQNAFSNVTVGSTTIAADTTTDTLTLVAGSNVTLTPDATNDKITIAATDTKYTHPSYTARTGVPTANATLSFGGTFNVSQPVSDATGHITAVNSRTYTMPSDRLFTTLTPTGTVIPQNADLATSTYLKVGRYYCAQDLIAATLKNAPTTNAFMMEVYSPLSTTIDNESGAWVYRVRKITTYMGEQYIQYSYTGGTAGLWNHKPWRRIYHSGAITYGTAAPSGTAVNGDIYFREDIHATLPITEGGTGATSVSAARANLGLNHVGAAAVCKSDSRTISIKTAGGFAVIPMVQSALRTNDSNFTISNNGIQCPYSGYVYITGAIYVNTSGLAGCYIYKNGDNGELHSQYHTCSGCISSGGMLVPVTAGDVITMKARSSTTNPTIGGNNKGTHLSIIYVA